MKESVAIVLQFEDEIYGIVRAHDRPAFPGYFSFPGGICDHKDHTHVAQSLPWTLQGPLHAATLVRELLEETGLDLIQLLRDGEVSGFEFLGRAQTPDFNPVRFETFYYAIRLRHRPRILLCQREFKSGEWATPEQHLQRFWRALVPMVPVTRWLLESLQARKSPPYELNVSYDAELVVPMIMPVAGVEQFLPRSPTLPPATRTNAFYLGDDDAEKILIDPSPQDLAEYERLIRAFGSRRLDAIFITHHHPDHHHLAPELAKHFDVPLKMSTRTLQLLEKKFPMNYLRDCRVVQVHEGQTLTRSMGVEVKILAVPGHDSGQLAPYRTDLAWIIASDLIQTVGTVVIGGEEGDMLAYFESMQKVMAMNPRMVFPSHGIVMGGIYKLKETLSHRQLREQQIIELMRQGKDADAIFQHIYAELAPGLEYLARKTIEAHIKKIHMQNLLGEKS